MRFRRFRGQFVIWDWAGDVFAFFELTVFVVGGYETQTW